MSAYDLWHRGQQIVNECLNEALEGKLPSTERLNELEKILQRLRKILRYVEAKIEDLYAADFAPWRGPSGQIGSAWDLESICRAIVQTKTSSIEWDSIRKWETECGGFMRRIAKLVETTQKATSGKKAKKRTMNTKAADCARLYRSDNGKTPMKTIVEDYVGKHSGSEQSIMRTLNDNPDQWKDDTKTTF